MRARALEERGVGGVGGNPQREQVGDTGAFFFLVQRLYVTPHILGVGDLRTLLN